jgi:dipeptidyl-peptidase 4
MTLNALFRYPEIYAAGVSIAPVPNQLYYDTIYQERYMGLAKRQLGRIPIGLADNLCGQAQRETSC